MSRYLVGIDLGTTNIALAYVDTASKAAGGPKLHTFNVPQVVAAGQVQDAAAVAVVPLPPRPARSRARVHRPAVEEEPARHRRRVRPQPRGKVPGRLVSTAKSWLCHPGVDRTAPLLPWAAPPDVPRLSPLEVSARYLEAPRRGLERGPEPQARTTSSKSKTSCSRCRRRSTMWPAT